ncbi:WhiB family transcriptional regulator, partial [Mycolicibacterium fortuitum]|uniref:WhiB family transcriptional regulator n=1 Tax=Mycolicibacterium fortuitum TaxID=1766 RepID=UPI0007E9A9D4
MTIIGTFEHLINREPWQAEGICRQVDPEIFFPEKGQSTKDAKRVCANCPVAAECLEYALVNGAQADEAEGRMIDTRIITAAADVKAAAAAFAQHDTAA